MTSIRVGGLFTGIGAHHSAVRRIMDERQDVTFEVVFQCEFDQKTALAYDTMHGETLNLGDVTRVKDIGGDLQVDILFWTPPCQDISLAGQGRGNDENSGTRSSLAFEVPRILSNTPERERPKYLIFEEVPMMLSQKFVSNFKTIRDRLTALGYCHSYGIMNASDYGVAQSRRRCFMISKLGAPAPRLPKPMPLTKCLKDYLEPEPVAKRYYLSSEQVSKFLYDNEKNKSKGNCFKFRITKEEEIARAITTKAGQRPVDTYLEVGSD